MPFKGLRYAEQPDQSRLIAPPYDVIDGADRQSLLSRSPHNMVRLILPDAAGGLDCYQAAAALWGQWQSEGVLREDAQPAYYVLEQSFMYAGGQYRRRLVIGALELCRFGEGQVLPHEYILSTSKEDRFSLIKATGANLSPIFGLFADDERLLLGWLERAAGKQAAACQANGSDGTLNRLSLVTDAALQAELAGILESGPVVIADGHHRYEAALRYRDLLAAQRTPEHPANFVLAAVGSMQSEEMLILPSHRVVHGTGRAEELAQRLAADFTVSPADMPALERLAAQKKVPGRIVLGYLAPEGAFMLEYANDALPPTAAPTVPLAYRQLDVAVLHAALERHLGIDAEVLAHKRSVNFVRTVHEAAAALRDGAECAFILRPTLLREVRSVAAAGCRMPQKSTYFYPKIPCGLVMRTAR